MIRPTYGALLGRAAVAVPLFNRQSGDRRRDALDQRQMSAELEADRISERRVFRLPSRARRTSSKPVEG